MKKIDVTSLVMDRVVRFEKKRTTRWLVIFLGIVVALAGLLGVSLFFVGQSLFEEEVLNLLSLYAFDKETLFMLWRDALEFVWDTIPHDMTIYAALLIVGLSVLVLVTRHKRRVVSRRMKEIGKFRSSR